MYLLAQVQLRWSKTALGASQQQPVTFRVLARQQSGSLWMVVETPENVICDGAALPKPWPDLYPNPESLLYEGQLVLIQQNQQGEITSLTDAVPFVLNLIRTYLSQGVSEAQFLQETERVEEWRQQLALKSQELSRQRVEVETRKVQIEQLAESLKRDRQDLDRQKQELAAQLQELEHLRCSQSGP